MEVLGDPSAPHPRVQEQVDVLVEKSLVLLVAGAEVLQELVSQFHDLLHSDVFTLSQTQTV